MLTEEDRFLFDLQGFIKLEGVLAPDEIASMLRTMEEAGIKDPENNPNKSRFGNFLAWSAAYRNLIDHPRILPWLFELLGPKFRLDHAYGMAARAGATAEGHSLHHTSYLWNHGCYYLVEKGVMHNGLIVVSFALTDIAPNAGGFCCIPGTHKVNYPMPRKWYDLKDNPLAKQIPQKAGDVVIFTEALTHGTWPWTDAKSERRSVLLKYCPSYMRWAQKDMNAEIEGLTPRQKQILLGPAVGDRDPIPPDA
ncbi:MAG: phytanoyl-CoA dioxygenase family protein [Planctomycetota bacterium]|nr:phytanoyl-CoA dioxygenase family protein [Planctomycetota bacterium]